MTESGFLKAFPDSDGYAMIYGRADINDIDGTVERVEKNLRKARGEEEGQEEFYVASFTEQLESFSSALNVVIGFIILIALISVTYIFIKLHSPFLTDFSLFSLLKDYFTDFGADFGFGVFGFVMASLGIILSWRRKKENSFFYITLISLFI